MQMLATEIRIRKMREAWDDSTDAISDQFEALQKWSRFLGPLSTIFSLFGLARLATPAGAVSTGLGAVSNLLMNIPKFQQGGDFIATQPRIIMVGERPERVTITPQTEAVPAGNTYHIHLHAPIPEEYVRDELLPVINRVSAA